MASQTQKEAPFLPSWRNGCTSRYILQMKKPEDYLMAKAFNLNSDLVPEPRAYLEMERAYCWSRSAQFATSARLTEQSQRRVTFHLPDGSQESCSDSGLGDHEPVGSGTLISHPLPLVQPQDEFYDQASPDKRTEADGNSDPNSGRIYREVLFELNLMDEDEISDRWLWSVKQEKREMSQFAQKCHVVFNVRCKAEERNNISPDVLDPSGGELPECEGPTFGEDEQNVRGSAEDLQGDPWDNRRNSAAAHNTRPFLT
ncbi:hypothetical protein PANDA_000868 [Ailuropoda melanoleuca]|uniref:Uncharacterized protein n=1 Tax=Ailuropoda melanoleuca TaxID=9646 RepID=D2GVU0_AILME|nr:hypothetical protein PANDA_000868 [Ailuropoda melanoleuca]